MPSEIGEELKQPPSRDIPLIKVPGRRVMNHRFVFRSRTKRFARRFGELQLGSVAALQLELVAPNRPFHVGPNRCRFSGESFLVR